MSNTPELVLSLTPPGPDFAISDQAVMPEITAFATLHGISLPPGATLQYEWTVTLRFTGAHCTHAMGKATRHPDIHRSTVANSLTIPFSVIRGGDLVVSVSATVGATTLRAKSSGLRVVGTNPTVAGLFVETGSAPDAFKKLMRLESRLRQFLAPPCPLFSSDNLGGVGLCQLTPPANDDQVWSWKANLRGGLALYREKERIAKAYPGHVRQSAAFRAQVTAYNSQRVAAGGAAVIVTVPDYTADQLERDTVRAFNGYAGGLHEYRLKTDANGILAVTLDRSGRSGSAEWERVSAADRTAYYDQRGIAANRRGDPNYVDDVMRQASF